MTNFEWLMTLSEEEFTDWVYDQWLHHLQYRWSSSRGGLMIWLKEERAEQTEPQTSCKTCRYGEVDEGYVRCAYYSNADRKTENSSEKPNNSTISKMEQVEDEPQTETEIAKAIVHKMIDDAVIAEDAYPDLRQKMHDAVDEYEPQTGGNE